MNLRLRRLHNEMLIVSRIYAEIGHGKRIALAKLAIESLEKNSRPLRIAVDVSIWQFQIQSGRGRFCHS